MKTFTIGGTSTGPDGVLQWRFANGSAAARTEILRRNHHYNIRFVELPNPMTKDEGMAWLLAQGFSAEVLIPGRRNTVVTQDSNQNLVVTVVDADRTPRPVTAVERVARQLHRQEPFVRWLAWEHLQPNMRADLLSRAAAQLAKA